MSCILYYSNFCQHSKKLLQSAAKLSLEKEVHFIGIDNREQIQGKTFVILNDGSKMILPENIIKVPALLLLNDNYRVLFGESIYTFLSRIKPQSHQQDQHSVQQQQPMMNYNSEPSCYSFSNTGFISSDNYSFLDMDADSLGTKGNGGLRQMHNYVQLNNEQTINTPSDEFDYKTDRQGELTMEAYQAKRDADMNNIKYKEC